MEDSDRAELKKQVEKKVSGMLEMLYHNKPKVAVKAQSVEGVEFDKVNTYAELWVGDHVNGPTSFHVGM